MPPNVFISHASENAAIAERLVHFLELNGVPCWIVPRDVVPGQEYLEALASAIDDCAVFLILFSVNAAESVHVQNEIERAAAQGKPIILVRLDQTDITVNRGLHLLLARHHWLDASQGALEDYLEAISEATRVLYNQNIDK